MCKAFSILTFVVVMPVSFSHPSDHQRMFHVSTSCPFYAFFVLYDIDKRNRFQRILIT